MVDPYTPYRSGYSMEAISNFLGNTYVLVGMVLALLALAGLMAYMRMKKDDE